MVGLMVVVALAGTAFGFAFAVKAAWAIGPKMDVLPLLCSIFAFGAVFVSVAIAALDCATA